MRLAPIQLTTGIIVHRWRLDEDAALLQRLCQQSGICTEDLRDVTPHRQREVMAERLLLNPLTKAPLQHDIHGAPMVEGLNVSLSHTSDMVCMAVSDKRPVGVDVERQDRKQVLRVRHKFLNIDEQAQVEPDDLLTHITLWTCKEALIKWSRKRDIDWTNDIRVAPVPLRQHDGVKVLAARCEGVACTLLSAVIDSHVITVAMSTDD